MNHRIIRNNHMIRGKKALTEYCIYASWLATGREGNPARRPKKKIPHAVVGAQKDLKRATKKRDVEQAEKIIWRTVGSLREQEISTIRLARNSHLIFASSSFPSSLSSLARPCFLPQWRDGKRWSTAGRVFPRGFHILFGPPACPSELSEVWNFDSGENGDWLLHKCNEKHVTKDCSAPFVYSFVLIFFSKHEKDRSNASLVLLLYMIQFCSLLVVQCETHACIDFTNYDSLQENEEKEKCTRNAALIGSPHNLTWVPSSSKTRNTWRTFWQCATWLRYLTSMTDTSRADS
jgi:hypothetical protein